MNRYLYFIIFCSGMILLLVSCNKNEKIDEKKFFDLYEEILIARLAEPDTTLANPKIRELFVKFDYSQEQFKADFIQLSQSYEGQHFAKKIDSLRQHTQQTQPPPPN